MGPQGSTAGGARREDVWKTAIERTGSTEGRRVLDLACGSGEFCAAATEAGARATGIDISKAMIALARQASTPEPHEKLTIDIPQEHPDEATMPRSFLSVGSYQRIIESEGEEKVVQKIKAAVEPFRTSDGTYRFSNKYLMSVFRKNGQAARTS